MPKPLTRAADPRKIQTPGERVTRDIDLADVALELSLPEAAAICLRAASFSLPGVQRADLREKLASEIAARRAVA